MPLDGSLQPRAEHDALGLAAKMESEMRDAKEQLQSLNEEHDTALEELRSANEELHMVINGQNLRALASCFKKKW